MRKGQRIKAYSNRQFWRLQEKELKQVENIRSGKVKEVILNGNKYLEQVITYKKHKYSRIVYRDMKTKQFTKVKPSKIRHEQKFTGFKTQQHKQFYRCAVFVEIPYHERYYWFGVIVIDEKENINIQDMKEDVLQLLERELHYNRDDFWFGWSFAIEQPKPYLANKKEKWYEKWNRTKPA